MPKFTTIALCLLGVALIIFLTADEDVAAAPATCETPQIVHAGLDAYASDGAAAALDTWFSSGPLGGDPEATASMLGILTRVEQMYGDYNGGEILRSVQVGESNCFVYLTMNYQKGALFTRLVLYKAGNKWIVTNGDVHTTPDEILPESMMAGL